MNHARLQFDDLIEGSPEERWSKVEALVAAKTPESLWLDFKTWDSSGDNADVPHIRDKFARSLSGFANVEGGVLAYGIETAKGAKAMPDVATAVKPVMSPLQRRAQLEKLARRVVNPPIGGLAFDAIVQPGSDAGAIIVFIPESSGGPHRVVEAGSEINDRYFMRTSTDHIVMPHGHLGDRFGHTARPQLRLALRVVGHPRPRLNFSVTNEGRGAALRPAVQIVKPPESIRMPGIASLRNGFELTREIQDGQWWYLIESVRDLVVYPGMTRELFEADLLNSERDHLAALKVECIVHALHMQPIREFFSITLLPP